MKKRDQFKMACIKIILCLTIMLPLHSVAQTSLTLSGTVKDKRTGEQIINANVKLLENKSAITTNSYGYYAISAPKGIYTLLVTNGGYTNFTQTITLDSNTTLNIELADLKSSEEIVIKSRKKSDNVTKVLMGVEKLNIAEINKLPVIFGERDILKSVQLLPGIKSAGEGNSGFYVRGGGADQNLILLDEAPVYNASHLLGFFSTFNSDAVKDVTLYKGGMPAQFGGRLSSVVDIKMKDGNSKATNISGGLGLISSRLNIEGPIKKNNGSFIVSGRRSYADLFLKLSPDTSLNKNKLYFYDFNLKANYKLGKKDRIYLSGYFGRDVLAFGNTFNTDWGNKTATLRYNHTFSSKMFSNTSLIYSDYNYNIRIKSNNNKFKIASQIQDFNFKQDFDYFANNKNKIKFGVNAIKHNVSPGRITADNSIITTSTKVQNRYSWESAIYGSHEVKFTDKFNMAYGLRLSNLTAIGPGKFFTYNNNGTIKDTLKYNKGKKVASYWNLEPRLSLNYQLNENQSVKASYNRNVQNLHLLTNATASSPTDLWLPSSNNVKPEIADQVSLGYFQNFNGGQYEFSAETYYKTMQNQIDYRNAADLLANDNVESELLYGKGRSYGIELLIKKKTGKFTGWVGYTLSKSEKQIVGINNGKWFNAKQDRTHDLSVVGIYSPNTRWTFSGTFVYSTGNAVTFPSGKYTVDNQTVFLYSERNGYRMPAYHRLDLSATLESKKNATRRFQKSWNFGLYNAYSRQNAFSIAFKDDPNDKTKTVAERTSLFKIVPSVTWNFKF